jgi:hemolysin III
MRSLALHLRPARRLKLREQIVDTITHGAGFLLAIAALVFLTLRASGSADALRIVACVIFGASLVLLYGASTLYHALHHTAARRVFQRMDHISIFFLIAGTYTPFCLILLPAAWGWSLFGVVWGIAIIGAGLKLWIGERYELLWVGLYVAMGWIVVVGLKPLLASTPPGGLALLVAGGVAYTAGVLFFVWERLPYNHGVWHLFVMAGSVFHFIAAYQYVA